MPNFTFRVVCVTLIYFVERYYKAEKHFLFTHTGENGENPLALIYWQLYCPTFKQQWSTSVRTKCSLMLAQSWSCVYLLMNTFVIRIIGAQIWNVQLFSFVHLLLFLYNTHCFNHRYIIKLLIGSSHWNPLKLMARIEGHVVIVSSHQVQFLHLFVFSFSVS